MVFQKSYVKFETKLPNRWLWELCSISSALDLIDWRREVGLNPSKRFSYFSFLRGFSDQLHLRSETLKMGVFIGQQVEVDYGEVSCILLYTLGVFLSGFRSKIACGKGCLSHPGQLPNVLNFELALFHVIQSIICQKHSITLDVGPFFTFPGQNQLYLHTNSLKSLFPRILHVFQ